MGVIRLNGVVGTSAQGVASTDFQAGVQTVSALQALDENSRADKQIRLLEDKGNSYRFDSTSTATTDGDEVIRPDDVSSDSSAGRWIKIVGLGGDVVGPASSTDNSIARYSGTGGKTVQGSTVYIDDSGNLGVGTSGPGAQLDVHDTTTSSANTGGKIRLSANDGSPMGDSHRLGVVEFTGAEDSSGTQVVGARIEALTDAAWTNVENGTALYFYTTDGNASQTNVLKLDSNEKATFSGNVDITGGLSFDAGTAVTSIDTDISSVSGSDDTLASAKAIKTYVDAQVTAQDLDITTDDGTNTGIDLDSETLTISGGEGIDTSATGNTVTIAAEESTAANKGVVIVAGGTGASVSYSSGTATVAVGGLTVSEIAGATLVTESEGIGSNDNDTTLPTSAAVKDYVDTKVTAEDLDITTDSGTIDIDLDGDTLTITGGEGIDTSATGTTVTVAAEEGTAANKGAVIVAGGTGATVSYSSGTATVAVDAAQSGITSLGTLTALTVDDVAVDGKVITMTGSTDDTATITVGTNGTLAITTVDTASDDADITVTADGKITLDAAGIVELDSGNGNFKFEKAGSTVLEFDEENSGDVVMMVATDGKDLIFKDHGEATNMKILDAAAGINVPGEVQTTKIAYTDGDDAMTVADGGKVTFAAGFDVGSDAAGDMLYHNGTSYVRLAKGSADQVLTMNDAANAPGWEDAAGGGGDTTELHVQTDSSSGSGSAATIDSDAGVVMCVTASGARYVQLPAVSGNTDRRIFIKDKSGSASTNNITIHTNSTEEIDGDDADLVISTNWASVQLVCDGSKWYII